MYDCVKVVLNEKISSFISHLPTRYMHCIRL